jgi:hypothetical protein
MANIAKTYTFANGTPADATQVNKNFDDIINGVGDLTTLRPTVASLGLDADLTTLALPANTTISAAGAELINDANAAAQLVTLGAAPALITINAQTGTTYTLLLIDSGALVTFANAAAIAVTIPTNAAVAFPIGTQIDCEQILAGKVTFGGAGVTINSIGGYKSIGAQWTGVSLIKVATDTWNLLGDLIT